MSVGRAFTETEAEFAKRCPHERDDGRNVCGLYLPYRKSLHGVALASTDTPARRSTSNALVVVTMPGRSR